MNTLSAHRLNHTQRLRMQEKFADYWTFQLADLFEVPDQRQLFTWLFLCSFDFTLIEECIADLRNRASQVNPPMNPDDPWSHMLKHFSSVLIRKTRARYGKVRPQESERVAA